MPVGLRSMRSGIDALDKKDDPRVFLYEGGFENAGPKMPDLERRPENAALRTPKVVSSAPAIKPETHRRALRGEIIRVFRIEDRIPAR